MTKLIALVCLCALAFDGCAPKGIEPLHKPNRIESFCGDTPENTRLYARTTSMGSILSTAYEDLPAAAPPLPKYREGLKSAGGAIAHYDKPLHLLKPSLAKALGTGEYVEIRQAIFTNELSPSGDRYIYVELNDHGTFRWQALRVYDLQNICNDGKHLA